MVGSRLEAIVGLEVITIRLEAIASRKEEKLDISMRWWSESHYFYLFMPFPYYNTTCQQFVLYAFSF